MEFKSQSVQPFNNTGGFNSVLKSMGWRYPPDTKKKSYIRAKFLAQRDNTVDVYPGQVQFFFQHTIGNTTHNLAFVRWYRPHQTRRFHFALANEAHSCGVEMWQQEFYSDSHDCIIPVQMILSHFVSYKMQFTSRNREYNVLVVIPINKRFHIWLLIRNQ